ncbi:hypothetical protein FHG87_015213 [Trinorchestia longiramus]|nr:hypothetical protein FHG87_015213 [Trinorchestia longiramus]
MSRSQDSNTPLLSTTKPTAPEGAPSRGGDSAFSRQGSLIRPPQYPSTVPPPQSCKTRVGNLSPEQSAEMGAFSPSYAYHQQFGDAKSGSKWPSETWMSESPFLFGSTTKGMRALDTETSIGAHGPPMSALVSPLSSPGSVDLRRHSAYMRPFEHVQTLEEEKDRLLRQPIRSQVDKTGADFPQNTLPRQTSTSKGNINPQAQITGSSPHGFSSTLNPRQFGSHSMSKVLFNAQMKKKAKQTTQLSR